MGRVWTDLVSLDELVDLFFGGDDSSFLGLLELGSTGLDCHRPDQTTSVNQA
jgi:hypothetical protein